MNFALLYGTGVKKLAKMLGVSEAEARDIKALYFARLPHVKAFLQHVVRTAETRGYVYNWLGRKYWCGNFDYSYAIPNHLIQGGCADVIKKAMVDIWRQIPGNEIRLQVHDELDFELAESEFDKVMDIKRIMESVFIPKGGTRLTVSVKESDRSLAVWDMNEGISF